MIGSRPISGNIAELELRVRTIVQFVLFAPFFNDIRKGFKV